MGVQVKKGSVTNGFTRDEDPHKYFPGFQAANADQFMRLSSEECAQAVDVLYDVDYSALASDDSDASDVVDALGAFAPFVSQGGFSIGSIINAIIIAGDTIEHVLEDVRRGPVTGRCLGKRCLAPCAPWETGTVRWSLRNQDAARAGRHGILRPRGRSADRSPGRGGRCSWRRWSG